MTLPTWCRLLLHGRQRSAFVRYGVAAWRIIAGMSNNEILRDRPFRQCISYPVCPLLTKPPAAAIPMRIKCVTPDPTIVWPSFRSIMPKQNFVCLGSEFL